MSFVKNLKSSVRNKVFELPETTLFLIKTAEAKLQENLTKG